ncbi:MAG: NAD(P)/FAD-dependent oxidoreductase, partial [Paracoccaceae bacterium]
SWAMKKTAGFIPEVLTGAAVREHEPILGPAISCLAVLKGQGHILNPLGYITELAAVFAHMGGKFIQTKVQDFERSGDKIQAVLTDQGRFECEKIVVTAGIWSRALMVKLGLTVPLETERGYHVIYKNPSEMPRNPMMMTTGKFGVTPMSDGLRCAGTVELGGIELGPSKAPIKLLRRRVAEAFPKLRYEATEEWMGFRPSTPDSLPLIGELGKSGIFTAFGHQHIGLTAGPKTGRLIADIIDQRSPNMDMRPYDPQRYNQ